MTNQSVKRAGHTARLRTGLPAFVCGSVSTLLGLGLVVRISAQPVPSTIVDVCANAEGTLRLTDPGVACPPGERRLRLRQPEIEKPKEDQAAENRRTEALEARLKNLEEQVSHRRLAPSRVVAPFEVVTENDQKVLLVDEGQMRFYNGAGKLVARIVANENGGYLDTQSSTRDLHAVIGTSDQRASVLIMEGSRERISLGRSEKGGYGLRVNEPGGKTIAGIGESPNGGGVVGVGDKTAEQRARLYVNPKGGGILEILNSEGLGVATLSTREQGSGLLQLTNGSGEVMVEAGVTKNDIGVVMAGPGAFQPGVGLVTGLPGSYIQGKPK